MATKYTSFRQKDRGRLSRTWPMPVKPSTSSYCTPRGMMAKVQILMASKASWASTGSWVNSRTNSGPATRASTKSSVV